jgi:uncharacterized paraquat-inducible protein A
MASNNASKKINCKYCNTSVDVGKDTVAVTCWRCTSKLAGGHEWTDKIFLDEIESIVNESEDVKEETTE